MNDPVSGSYVSADGEIYRVNMHVGAAAEITNKKQKLCLLFWLSVKEEKGKLLLVGQECSHGKFNENNWKAEYSYSKKNVFILYPPKNLNKPKTQPFEITYIKG